MFVLVLGGGRGSVYCVFCFCYVFFVFVFVTFLFLFLFCFMLKKKSVKKTQKKQKRKKTHTQQQKKKTHNQNLHCCVFCCSHCESWLLDTVINQRNELVTWLVGGSLHSERKLGGKNMYCDIFFGFFFPFLFLFPCFVNPSKQFVTWSVSSGETLLELPCILLFLAWFYCHEMAEAWRHLLEWTKKEKKIQQWRH